MFGVALFEPEIPPNTGNIIRLCANAGCGLHLIEPLGFRLDDRSLKRAGLDYHEYASVVTHESYPAFRRAMGDRRVFAFSSRGAASCFEVDYAAGDVFLFGPETRGLPAAIRGEFAADYLIRIPMRPGNRSLNISNAVAIVVYEAWRQCGFDGDLGE